MGKRVNWKYVLKDDVNAKLSETVLWAPTDIRNISIGVQANTACLWAEVDPKSVSRWYRIKIVGTGEEILEGRYLGRCALTVEGKTVPTPTDNSVQHFYLVDDTAEEAAAALALPLKGPGSGQVIRVPLWAARTAGVA